MRSGGFPGQFEAIKARVAQIRAEAEQAKQRASRRMFLGLAVGGVVGACAGDGAVHALHGAGEERSATGAVDASLDWARALATGPLDGLLQAQATFIASMIQAGRLDDGLWVGVIRLTNAYVERDARVPPAMGASLRLLARKCEVPANLRPWFALVEQRGR